MLNSTFVTKETYMSKNQILFVVDPQVSVGAVVDDALGTQDSETGKKIVKAGTPLTGSLTERGTAFTAAKAGSSSEASDAVGILLHDVDVTNGDGNGTLLIFGFVDMKKIDGTTAAKITDYVKAALPMIKFCK